MKKYLCNIFTVSMMLMSLTASAQEKQDLRQVYTKAEEAYQIGQLDQAIELLEGNLNDFTGNLRQSALRLVSICYLAQDDTDTSEKYARSLLSINPYYTSVQDPVRFEDMIALLKSGRSSTVTTASSQAESGTDTCNLCAWFERSLCLVHFECCHAWCLYVQSRKDPNHGKRAPSKYANNQ